MVLEQYATAEALEHYLGNPLERNAPVSFTRSMQYDEAESYPEVSIACLADWGLHHYYIPMELGGRLRSFEELLWLTRVVARRDLTLALSHANTMLGALGVWMAGTAEQKLALAEMLRNGHRVALALTEREHGSDLLANELVAEPTPTGYRLTGEKWLIGNATRGSTLTVLARTDPRGGAQGFSLFFVEKDAVDPATWESLPKVKTLGLRGHDLSGIRFRDCHVSDRALIGQQGQGLEIVLKVLNVSKTLCAGLSLGAADTALRATLDFARKRILYRNTVWAIPQVRDTLVNAFLDILICDAVATAAVRGLHAVPEQTSLVAPMVKHFVPATMEQTLYELSRVLGARFYLREDHWEGIFQKILRDHAILSIFDGSSAVNQDAISVQLCGVPSVSSDHGTEELRRRLRPMFRLSDPLPPFVPEEMTVYWREHDLAVRGLGAALALAEEQADRGAANARLVREVLRLGRTVQNYLRSLSAEFLRHSHPAYRRSSELFHLARQYCLVNAACTCIQLWVHNCDLLGPFFASGEWLVLSLTRLLTLAGFRERTPSEVVAKVAEEMESRLQQGKWYALVPVAMATSGT